jgi:hypothetical protein
MKKTKKQKAKESKPKVRKKAIPPSKRHKSKKDYKRNSEDIEKMFLKALNEISWL